MSGTRPLFRPHEPTNSIRTDLHSVASDERLTTAPEDEEI